MDYRPSTIIALSTPPGAGAIGVIRLSGPDAIAIVDRVFDGRKLADQAANTSHFGRIIDRVPSTQDADNVTSSTKLPDTQNTSPHESIPVTPPAPTQTPDYIDEVVVSLFRAPRSYTGEDVAEVSCHGSPYILQRVLEVLISAGAIPAAPGEFTQRAFLAGRMDLTQAEAVADLIASESAAAHRTAMHQLRGGFSAALKNMREELIHFAALIELEIDFAEEDVEFADRSALQQLLSRIDRETSALIQSFRLGNAIRKGISVAIIGPPNAGKSTLLNALLQDDRAIVSDIAGTTRDTIEETISIKGVLFRFIDTAGIREQAGDAIEEQGIARSRKKAAEADVVLTIYDGSAMTTGTIGTRRQTGPDRQEPNGRHFIDVINKADTMAGEVIRNCSLEFGGALFLSAKKLQGIDELREEIYERAVRDELRPDAVIITNARHHAALLEISAAIRSIREGLSSGLSGDLLSHHIRQALFHIGELTGEIQTDRDILGTIFGKFCIGK